MSQVILITGCSTGLGLHIAVQAAQAGHRVFATMRHPHKRAALDAALAAAGVQATVLPLDVSDQSSVDAAVAQVMAQAARIDVLINNAGAGFGRTVEQASEAEINWVLDVNLRGVIRCTKAALPAMRAARSGRIITITSIGGLVGQPFNELYCAAKFGVEGFIESLATYVGPAFGIKFSIIEPGGISSDFFANAMAHSGPTDSGDPDEYAPLMAAYVAGFRARAGQGGTFQTPQEVAQIVLACMARNDPPLRLRTSDWAEEFTALKTSADPDGTTLRDRIVAQNFGKLPL